MDTVGRINITFLKFILSLFLFAICEQNFFSCMFSDQVLLVCKKAVCLDAGSFTMEDCRRVLCVPKWLRAAFFEDASPMEGGALWR